MNIYIHLSVYLSVDLSIYLLIYEYIYTYIYTYMYIFLYILNTYIQMCIQDISNTSCNFLGDIPLVSPSPTLNPHHAPSSPSAVSALPCVLVGATGGFRGRGSVASCCRKCDRDGETAPWRCRKSSWAVCMWLVCQLVC